MSDDEGETGGGRGAEEERGEGQQIEVKETDGWKPGGMTVCA